MCAPNFFSDASESLQDDFIHWLVACATEATGPLQECGLAFVRALFRAGAADGTKNIPVLASDGEMALHNGQCKVSDVSTPKRQYRKIDVYFQAKVDGKMVSFIIEDKVDTEAHSDQLAKYLDDVIKYEQKDLIKPVYFKTGYVFNYEREDVKKNKYSVFKAEDLKKFLDCHPDAIRENQILRQYEEYLNDKMEARVTALKEWCLNQDYVQWEFLRKLRGVLRAADDEWQHFVPNQFFGEPKWKKPDWNWKGLWRKKNNDGGPWTQYWFSKHLFWRLDWFPGRQKLNLRVQLRLRIDLYEANMSYDVVPEYRNRFDEALLQEGLCNGDVQMPKGNECTIGSVDIVNETTKFQGLTEDEFLDRVKRVHIRFLKSILVDM